MNEITRRNLLKTLFGGILPAIGTVVLARATLAGEGQANAAAPGDVLQRADQAAQAFPAGRGDLESVAFLNGAFRNGGGFRNGAFRNGGFVNGGFRNGSFRNGSFRNW